jgi:phosphoribosyl 1,2-cyclic phosphodiesterase
VRFACLGSGSKGNAWIVESGRTRVLLDCGFGIRDMVARLARLAVEPESIRAVLVTHEHSDHGRGVARFAARHGCQVRLTHGCHAMLAATSEMTLVAHSQIEVIDSHARFALDDLEIQVYPVPHDAREPVQYVVGDGASRFGLLTDAGHVTEHMVDILSGCQALALECNHDVDRLRNGSYPPALKARILGRYGHLDNGASAGLLARLAHPGLRHVVAAHLSEENNAPELARGALAQALDWSSDAIDVAEQQTGLEWRALT